MTQKIHARKSGHKPILSFRSLQKVVVWKLSIQKLFQHQFLTVEIPVTGVDRVNLQKLHWLHWLSATMRPPSWCF